MYQKDKNFIEFNQKEIDSFKKANLHDFLKKNIFSGKIIIFRNNQIILNIIHSVEKLLNHSFPDINIEELCKNKNYFKKESARIKFLESQKKIKHSLEIKDYFKELLINLGFKTPRTFTDQICLRYNSGKNTSKVGNLNLTQSHRDTWASNLFEQINWWFPIHNIFDDNSIYICPKYFNKYVENNSNEWSFESFLKNKKIYPSTPISCNKLKKKDKFLIKVNKGDLVCFSGHHIHGSNQGRGNRMNIENRTISLDDKKYNIPKNLDGKFKQVKTIWFNNIHNGINLKKVY